MKKKIEKVKQILHEMFLDSLRFGSCEFRIATQEEIAQNNI